MAVPAHDERDFEFAVKFELPVIAVVDPPAGLANRDDVLAGKACFATTGKAINSGPFDGKSTDEVKRSITQSLSDDGLGKSAVNYKLRDWLFSRQRFWGEPFPILHELNDAGEPTGRLRGVDPSDLPVRLPELDDFKPHGRPEPPLAKAGEDWLYVTIDGTRYRRETNTMPQWAGSCWYNDTRALWPLGQPRHDLGRGRIHGLRRRIRQSGFDKSSEEVSRWWPSNQRRTRREQPADLG